jgi:hypothetical protein
MMLNGGQERKSRLNRVYGVSDRVFVGFRSAQPNLQEASAHGQYVGWVDVRNPTLNKDRGPPWT